MLCKPQWNSWICCGWGQICQKQICLHGHDLANRSHKRSKHQDAALPFKNLDYLNLDQDSGAVVLTTLALQLTFCPSSFRADVSLSLTCKMNHRSAWPLPDAFKSPNFWLPFFNANTRILHHKLSYFSQLLLEKAPAFFLSPPVTVYTASFAAQGSGWHTLVSPPPTPG